MISELSILIPVFNQDVRPLVNELQRQCRQLQVQYEILLFDDASEESFRLVNRSLASATHIVYKELPENIGRSAIRNQLATKARYRYLLLLDNDCLPADENFIATYLHEAAGSDVVIGGIAYTDTKPAKAYRLHWKYGQRAAKPAAIRQKNMYQDVYLSNAFIQKELFLRFKLRESLKRYGHEDTVFALELKRQNIRVKHIENPALHLGLEPATTFLAKTEQAVENLVKLYQNGEQVEQLKIVRAYRSLQSYHLESVFAAVLRKFSSLLKLNLTSSNPSLFIFDVYRLYLFSQKMRQR